MVGGGRCGRLVGESRHENRRPTGHLPEYSRRYRGCVSGWLADLTIGWAAHYKFWRDKHRVGARVAGGGDHIVGDRQSLQETLARLTLLLFKKKGASERLFLCLFATLAGFLAFGYRSSIHHVRARCLALPVCAKLESKNGDPML
jgi:hypothetical protein